MAPSALRPPKELRGWAKLVVPAGTTSTATIELGAAAFQHWDVATNGWLVEPGEYDLVIAASAVDIRQTIRVTVGG